jgi:hypothetical protein
LTEEVGYIEPSGIDQVAIDLFLEKVEQHLLQSIKPCLTNFGNKVSGMVDKMVAPGSRENYRRPEQVIALAKLEISLMAQKINRYQYIDRYRFFFTAPNTDSGISFVEHMYSLKNAELYNVLERGEALVRFLSTIGADLGVGDAKAPNKYAKSFKRKFERRLKERHKITHAHERPSLVSRLLQLSELKSDDDKKILANILGAIFRTMNEALDILKELAPSAEHPPSPKDRKEFHEWYLEQVDGEASTMWETLSQSIHSAIGLPFNEENAQ